MLGCCNCSLDQTGAPFGRWPILILCLVVAGIMMALPARACDDSNLRQACFSAPRDTHQLCVISSAGDPVAAEQFDRLQAWLSDRTSELNVSLVRVAADDPEVNWEDYGIPSAPPSLPVVVLVGHGIDSRPFIIEHWEPGPSDKDLEGLCTSPALEAIKTNVINQWGVILFAPGRNSESSALPKALDAVATKWAIEHPPGISVVRLDRNDERERLLCSFIGLEDSGPDWAGIVVGRGKLLGPPLVGSQITEAKLDEQLRLLIERCTCLRSPSSLGVDLSMTWGADLDSEIVALQDSSTMKDDLQKLLAEMELRVPSTHRLVIATALFALGATALVAFATTVTVFWRRSRGRVASL